MQSSSLFKWTILSVGYVLLFSCTGKQENDLPGLFSSDISYMYEMPMYDDYVGDIETFKIRYSSDDLEITGFISKPKGNGPWPMMIFNRGGNRDFGAHGYRTLQYQRFLVTKGYVVLSTQLRGSIHSEGRDEFGGADLHDILKLIDIGKKLPFTVPDQLVVYGFSRGGLNTYQLLRMTDEIDAAAVIGGPTNPRLDFDTRPEMYTEVYLPLIGDTVTQKQAYDDRSPLLWADEINTPVLILHGEDDWRVKKINAELMIARMTELDKEFEAEIVPDGDHGLRTHMEWRDERVLKWFDKHLK